MKQFNEFVVGNYLNGGIDSGDLVCLDTNEKLKLFYYLTYFFYYSWALLHFLVLFMGPTILFQLTFSFIYSTFSNKFSVSAK